MKVFPAYVCEKCGFYRVGESNATAIERHEKIPVTGRKTSLIGLTVSFRPNEVLVIRPYKSLSQRHEFLYIWDKYHQMNMAEIRDLPPEIESVMRELIPETGFTAHWIIDNFLLPKDEDSRRHQSFEELAIGEFGRVTKILAKKYPDRYKGIEFKREFSK